MGDHLTCTLNIVSNDDNPEYNTLCYVWGDPTSNAEIVANGRAIKKTTNLHTALRYLRKTDESLTIWADGICITQSDLDERASQVRIMGDIYTMGRELQQKIVIG